MKITRTSTKRVTLTSQSCVIGLTYRNITLPNKDRVFLKIKNHISAGLSQLQFVDLECGTSLFFQPHEDGFIAVEAELLVKG